MSIKNKTKQQQQQQKQTDTENKTYNMNNIWLARQSRQYLVTVDHEFINVFTYVIKALKYFHCRELKNNKVNDFGYFKKMALMLMHSIREVFAFTNCKHIVFSTRLHHIIFQVNDSSGF